MKKRALIVVVVLFIIVSFVPDIMAQCPMCRLTAETNLQEGGGAGRGLNKGILYLLSMPYLIFGFLGYTWYRNRKRLTNDDEH